VQQYEVNSRSIHKTHHLTERDAGDEGGDLDEHFEGEGDQGSCNQTLVCECMSVVVCECMSV
jgi:hypothetical protein